jgi:hypothetical protein
MDRIKDFLWPQVGPTYKPVNDDNDPETDTLLSQSLHTVDTGLEIESPFHWSYYVVFTLLGVAMLWAWYVPHSVALIPSILTFT